LNNVIVNASQKLPKALDFGKGANVILRHSRIFVLWVAAGVCMGIYDNAIKYVSERRQFGQPISGMIYVYFRFSVDSIKNCKDYGYNSSYSIDVLPNF
jgi:alkylation response protein AidB-like acyl-CoA dehydrogenase